MRLLAALLLLVGSAFAIAGWRPGVPTDRPSPPLINSQGQQVLKDFDVAVLSLDANRFPLNPKWGQQYRDNTIPTPKVSCPVDDQDTRHWTSSSQFPNCTSFPVSFNGAWFCGHHVNFMPVTYQGRVTWNGGPGLRFFQDDDYTLNLFRDEDSALYTTTSGDVHVEFDASETVDNWDKTATWWENFHHNGAEKGDDHARAMIDGHSAVVIGLLGMDTWHSEKIELHPAYAVFVLLDHNMRLRQTSWAFFVRNWGNEGNCGSNQMNMYAQPIRVQIPDASGIVSSNLWYGARNTNNVSAINMSVQPNGAGILLGFGLLTPDNQSWIMGDITFQDKQLTIASVPEDKIPAEFEAVRARIDKLPESSQKELFALQQSVVPRKEGRRLQPTTIGEPTQLGDTLKSSALVVRNSDLVRPKTDSVGESNRRKKLEVLRKFLAKRGIRVQMKGQF